jgi:hypothetical protein
VEVQVLGTVEMRAGDRILDVGPPRQRVVLAALAVDAGRLVPAPPSPAPPAQPAPASPAPPSQRPAAPAQLPLDARGFAGRGAELAYLDAVLAASEHSAAVLISAVLGTAGVGKTALAVHWAHQVAGRFPDGQLYVNLRGFDPAGPALDSGEASRGFLVGLGVAPPQIPADRAAQVGLYRSLLAGRRILVVLDNARDAEQVRPLLPGAPGCLVVVTSRNQMASLVAAEGAYPLTLDLLTSTEAEDLLAGRLGLAALAAEPQAVDEIIARCARLPLALAVAAARAITHPRSGLATLAAQLRGASGGLDSFAGVPGRTATGRTGPRPPGHRARPGQVRASTICCVPTPPNSPSPTTPTQTSAPLCTGCSTTTCTPRTPPTA